MALVEATRLDGLIGVVNINLRPVLRPVAVPWNALTH